MSTEAAQRPETTPSQAASESADTSPDAGPDTGGLDTTVEAILISLDRATPVDAIVDAVAVGQASIGPDEIRAAIGRLNTIYDDAGRAFRIEEVSGGYRLMTRPEHATAVAAFHRARSGTRLSRAALETLSIIAYRQPITRAQLEAIRGVGCGEVLRGLIDRRMVMVKGRAEELGRPMLYGTTRQFLDCFGLASVKDLPDLDDPGSAQA
ncbi:MAG: segregation and condensation protein B [Phycisphaerales bacterium]|jgi:segregation and condensation protein B